MASKWAHLKGKLPPTPMASMSNAGDKKFVEKVDAEKFNYSQLSLKELQAELVAQDKAKDDINDALKDINVKLEALGQLIIARYEEDGVTKTTTETGKTIYLNIEPYVSVQDKAVFEQHIIDHADLDYLWSVHPQTLASLVKDHLEKGQDDQIPPGLGVFLKTAVRLRNS